MGIVILIFKLYYDPHINSEDPDAFLNSFMNWLNDGVGVDINWGMVQEKYIWYYISLMVWYHSCFEH